MTKSFDPTAIERAAQAAWDALQADGFPDLAAFHLSQNVLAELKREMDDLAAAASVFTADELKVGFDETVPHTDVSQPVPNQNP